MNCYLKVNDSKNLSVYNGNINFQGEHNAENITFLFPLILNEFDIATSTIMFNLVDKNGIGNVYILTQGIDLYHEYLAYNFAITDQFTLLENAYTCWITIISADGKIMKTSDYKFSVASKLTTSSIIPVTQMDLVDDLVLRVTAIENNTTHVIDDLSLSTATTYSSLKIDTTYANITTTDELKALDNNKTIGIVNFPTTTDNGDGSVTIGIDGIVNFSKVIDGNDNYYRYNIVNSATLFLNDNMTNYVYAYYNDDNPIYGFTNDNSIFYSDYRYCYLYRMIRDGNKIHTMDYGSYGTLLANKYLLKDIALRNFERQSGLALSTNATRISTISSGVAWFALTSYNMVENKSGTSGELYEYYQIGGVWSKQLVSLYDSTYYSSGTDRLTLSNNRWVAKYFFRDVGSDNHAYYIHGNQYVSENDAINEALPNIPPLVNSHSIYVGKIVIQKNSTNGTAYTRTWGTGIVTSYPNKSIIDDFISTTQSIILANNTEYRFGELTSLTVNWTIADIEVPFMSFSSGAIPTVFINADGTMYFLKNGTTTATFTPLANKAYHLRFKYDGIRKVCYIEEITI